MSAGNTCPRAIVIGGGVVGSACALNLQAQGVATLLIDCASARRGPSYGNAGHIAVEQVEPLASPTTLRNFGSRLFARGGALDLPPRDIATWLPFLLRALAASRPARFAAGKAALALLLSAAMPAWRRLLELAAAPDLLLERGHFVVWESSATAAAGHAAWSAADIGTASFRDATDDEMKALAAQTSTRLVRGIRFLGSGQIADLERLAVALDARFTELGGRQLCATVDSLPRSGRNAAVRLRGGETLQADTIVVAAGVASGRLLGPMGHRVPLIAERGYHIESATTDWPADLPPVVFEDRSMIVTRFRSSLRAASFVEFSRSDRPPDPRKWARLHAHVRALGLPIGTPCSEWMGCRPTLPDYLPALGRCERTSNLYYAFGHQHLGLTLAAITGEIVGALTTGEHPPVDITPFDLRRFQASSH